MGARGPRTRSPYGDFGVGRHFFDVRRMEAVAPETAVEALLLRLGDTGNAVSEFPLHVPRSRTHAVLRYGLDNPKAGSAVPPEEFGGRLRSVAKVADDAETVAGLLRFIDPALEPPFPYNDAHAAAYAVSRRAGVRVLPDHTIVPLP